MATSTIEEFDRFVRQALTKSLSHSRVEAVVESAMLNVHPDTPLVASILRHHRKATPPQKLHSLYLVDAIAREGRKRVKRALQEQSVSSFEPSTSTASSATPDYAAFMTELEAMLAKIVLDSWESGEQQHRVCPSSSFCFANADLPIERARPTDTVLSTAIPQEKVRKILEIWQKGGVFSSSSLSRINAKMAAFDQQGASGANGSASLSTSTAPPPSPPPGAYTDAATQDPPISAPSGLPASVLALFGAQSDPTSASTWTSSSSCSTTNGKGRPAFSIQDEVARAIEGAKSGVFLPNEPTPPPPPAIASWSVPSPPTPTSSALPFNASQFALVDLPAKRPPSLNDPSRSNLPPPALHSSNGPDSRNNRSVTSFVEQSSSSPVPRPLPSFPSTTANPSLVAAPPPPPPGFKPPLFLPLPQLTPSPAPTFAPPPYPSPLPSPTVSFDPSTFSALCPQSWTSLVDCLRATLFAHLTDREPTNGEVMAFVQMVTIRQQQQQSQQQQMMMSGIGFGIGFAAPGSGSGEVGTTNATATTTAIRHANGLTLSGPTLIGASSPMQTDYDGPTFHNPTRSQDE